MKRLFLLGVVIFLGVNWFLTHSTPAISPDNSDVEALTVKKERIRSVADLIEANPTNFQPSVAGVNLRQEQQEAQPPSLPQTESASHENQYLWEVHNLNDQQTRDQLFDEAIQLASYSEEARLFILEEAIQNFSRPHRSPADEEFASKALQAYLNYETDPWLQEDALNRSGISVMNLDEIPLE